MEVNVFFTFNGLHLTQFGLRGSVCSCVHSSMCLRLSPRIPTRPPPCYFPARFACRRAHDTGTNPELKRIQNSRIELFFKTERLLIHQRDLFFLSFTSSISIFTACGLVSIMKRIIKIVKVEEILLL